MHINDFLKRVNCSNQEFKDILKLFNIIWFYGLKSLIAVSFATDNHDYHGNFLYLIVNMDDEQSLIELINKGKDLIIFS